MDNMDLLERLLSFLAKECKYKVKWKEAPVTTGELQLLGFDNLFVLTHFSSNAT